MNFPPRSLVLAPIFLLLALPAVLVAAPATRPTTGPSERTIRLSDLPLKVEGATPQQAQWLAAFAPKAEPFDCGMTELPGDDAIRVVQVMYPSPVVTPWPEANVVPAELYLPRAFNGKLPAAIVLDILDGSAILPRGLCRGLAEQGVAALYVPMACYGPRRPANNAHFIYYGDHPEKTPDNMRQTIMDIRRGKAILTALPEINAEQISITGVSLGGIMTSLAAGVDGEFYRVVPILAGGDVAAITFHARETRRIREACQAKGITQEQLSTLLAPVEPLTFASRIRPSTCLMINAAADEVIPRATTDALNKAIGSPRMLFTPLGHYSSMLYLPNIRQRTIDFIKGKPVEGLEIKK